MPLRLDNGQNPPPVDAITDTESQTLLNQKAAKHTNYCCKLLQTTSLGLAFFTIGMKMSLAASTFLDLLQVSNTDLKTGSYLFVLSGLGSILGSLVAGVLCDKNWGHVSLSASLTLMGVGCTVIPCPTSFPLVLTATFVTYIGMGITETAVPFLVNRLWDEDRTSVTQAMFLCMSAGGIVGPIIAEPFTSSALESQEIRRDFIFNGTSASRMYENFAPTINKTAWTDEHRINTPFFIVGVICVFMASLWAVVCCFNRSQYSNNNNDENVSSEVQSVRNIDGNGSVELSPKGHFAVLVLVAVFFCVYDGMEDGVGNFLTTILVDSMGWTQSNGVRATSVCWAFHTGGQAVSIYLTKILSPFVLLFLCFSGLTSVYVLFLWFLKRQTAVSWILIALFGFFMAPLYSTSVSITNKLSAKGLMFSLIVIASDVGCLLNPVVIGYLLQEAQPMAAVYALMGACLLSVLIMVFIRLSVKYFRREQ